MGKLHTELEIGTKFGRWKIAGQRILASHSKYCYPCECECGNKRDISYASLIAGLSKSCGCLKSELTKSRLTTHGFTGTRLSNIFNGMKTRCYNTNAREYDYYGNRNIVICDEWLNDPNAFFSWSLKHGYTDNLSIDRIDSSGNYCPTNCRWIDQKAQTNNTRRNVLITAFGSTKNIKQWVDDDRCDVTYGTLRRRILRKWQPEIAITQV